MVSIPGYHTRQSKPWTLTVDGTGSFIGIKTVQGPVQMAGNPFMIDIIDGEHFTVENTGSADSLDISKGRSRTRIVLAIQSAGVTGMRISSK